MLIHSIVMAPKKAVVTSRRSIRAVVRKSKASSDSQSVDMSSASAETVVGSAKNLQRKGHALELVPLSCRVHLEARSPESRGDPG